MNPDPKRDSLSAHASDDSSDGLISPTASPLGLEIIFVNGVYHCYLVVDRLDPVQISSSCGKTRNKIYSRGFAQNA